MSQYVEVPEPILNSPLEKLARYWRSCRPTFPDRSRLTADESGTVFNTNKLACSHLCSVPDCEPIHTLASAAPLLEVWEESGRRRSFPSVIATVIALAILLALLLYFQKCWVPKHSPKSGPDWAYRKSIWPVWLVYLSPV